MVRFSMVRCLDGIIRTTSAMARMMRAEEITGNSDAHYSMSEEYTVSVPAKAGSFMDASSWGGR